MLIRVDYSPAGMETTYIARASLQVNRFSSFPSSTRRLVGSWNTSTAAHPRLKRRGRTATVKGKSMSFL